MAVLIDQSGGGTGQDLPGYGSYQQAYYGDWQTAFQSFLSAGDIGYQDFSRLSPGAQKYLVYYFVGAWSTNQLDKFRAQVPTLLQHIQSNPNQNFSLPSLGVNAYYQDADAFLNALKNPAVQQAVNQFGAGSEQATNAAKSAQSLSEVAPPTGPFIGGAGGGGGGGSPTFGFNGPTIAQQSSALVRELKQAMPGMPFDITPFVQKALQSGVPDPGAYAYDLIVKSPQFDHYFPGIKKPDGSLRMSPAAYVQYADQTIADAKKQGFNLSRTEVGSLVSQNVSSEEFKYRLDAAGAIRSHADVLAAFNQELQSQGMRPITTAQQAFDFITGKSQQQVYQTYQAAAIKAASAQAGASLTTEEAMQQAKAIPNPLSFEDIEKGYTDIAKNVRNAGVELSEFGLSSKDLATIEFGGQNRIALAMKANQAMMQYQAGVKERDITGAIGTTPGGAIIEPNVKLKSAAQSE